MNDDVVFLSTAVAGQIVGLQQESALRWRVHFFGVDLGCVEIVGFCDAFTSDAVTPPVSTCEMAPALVSAPSKPDRTHPRRRPSPPRKRAAPLTEVSAMS
jgi:hypothetical protein